MAAIAAAHQIDDIDGACIRSDNRGFTRDLSRWIYQWSDDAGPLDGVEFESRHGNDLALWATYERSNDPGSTHCLTDARREPLNRNDPDLHRALSHHHLTLSAD